MKKNNVLPMLMPAIVLTIISVVIAGVLAVANHFTAPAIEKNAEKATNDALTLVVPTANEFKIVEKSEESTNENDIYIAYSEDGKEMGYAVSVAPLGFGGNIDIIVGFSIDKTISGIEIVNSSETPGLGSKASDKEFKLQFLEKTPPLTVGKNQESGKNTISAISGATITSKAVTSGVNTAMTELNNYLGGNLNGK